MIRRLAALLALLPACVVHYLVGTCPEGQVECDGRCAADCPLTCPEGQEPCGPKCVPDASDCDETHDTDDTKADDTTPTTGDANTDNSDTCDTKCGDDPCAACDPQLELCADDACACRPGLTRCGDDCVDLRTDPAHCGECGLDCKTGVCQAEVCREACAGDLSNCDGACVELKQDSLHCGDCATLCPADEVCLAATCHAYTPADDCTDCPCPACDGQTCCPSNYLGAPVCIADKCGG